VKISQKASFMRKQFCSYAIFVLVLFLSASCSEKKELNTDVLVIGGTTSGISAGIQSARWGEG